MSSICEIASSLTPTFKDFLLSQYDNYQLPIEVWDIVLLHLNPTDVYNLMYCNKTFFKIVLTNAHSLSLNFKKTLHLNELCLLFYANEIIYNCVLMNKIKFISIMNIVNFANSKQVDNQFDKIYNNNSIISAGCNDMQSRQFLQYIINPSQVVPRYNAKIRYGLLKAFCIDKLIINDLMFYIIKFTSIDTFNKLLIIIMKLPEIIDTMHIRNMRTINNFFNNKYKTQNFTLEKIVNMIKYNAYFGGKPGKALAHLAYDRFKVYTDSLICGVKEEDANHYAATRFSIEQDLLLTFKALVPVVGYFYAKYFILDIPHNLDDYPYFVQVASKMNSHNFYCIEKCKTFSKVGGDIDKVLTLRNRKRKLEH